MKSTRNNRKTVFQAGFALAVLLMLAGCEKEKKETPRSNQPPNEEELITTVRAYFVHSVTGDTTEFSWVDLDGDGGNAPVITGGTLQAGSSYAMSVLLLDESGSPADTISNEVAAEAEEHQFFFSANGGALTWLSYADADANGMPIGLASVWATAAAGSGEVTIILRHEPNKGAAGVSAGDITNAGGETDIEVAIPYVVQ